MKYWSPGPCFLGPNSPDRSYWEVRLCFTGNEASDTLSLGRRTNVIAAMSQDGVIALELVSGPVNGDIFNFVSSSLIPMMMPYNGVNSRSVLIMDNCSSVHHVNGRMFATACGYYHTVPPDFNPAEEAFSYVKGYLKIHDDLLQAGPQRLIISSKKHLNKSQTNIVNHG